MSVDGPHRDIILSMYDIHAWSTNKYRTLAAQIGLGESQRHIIRGVQIDMETSNFIRVCACLLFHDNSCLRVFPQDKRRVQRVWHMRGDEDLPRKKKEGGKKKRRKKTDASRKSQPQSLWTRVQLSYHIWPLLSPLFSTDGLLLGTNSGHSRTYSFLPFPRRTSASLLCTNTFPVQLQPPGGRGASVCGINSTHGVRFEWSPVYTKWEDF